MFTPLILQLAGYKVLKQTLKTDLKLAEIKQRKRTTVSVYHTIFSRLLAIFKRQ